MGQVIQHVEFSLMPMRFFRNSRVLCCASATSFSTILLVTAARIAETTTSCHSSQLTPQANFCTRAQSNMALKLEKAKQEALWGLFIGDSVAMPVHWYYNPRDIHRGYGGWLTGYTAPAKKHPSSILTVSAIDGSGRTGWSKKKKSVIGNVILQDKLKYWQSGDRSTHYHQGMAAGDNTLNALTALETVKVMQRVDPDGKLHPDALQEAVMENYVTFMTTPNTHNDTYAESFHRAFFQDWMILDDPPRDGKSIVAFSKKRYTDVERSRSEDHQLAVIGAVDLAIPWILHYADTTADECAKRTVDAIKLTHPAPSLMPFIDLYARTLQAVLHGAPLKNEVLKALSSQVLGGQRKRQSIEKLSQQASQKPAGSEARLEVYQDAIGWLGSACYIDGSLPSLLFLAHEFHGDFGQGVLTNANCGGENVHRGAGLATLLAAETVNRGEEVPQKWKDGLHSARQSISECMMNKI